MILLLHACDFSCTCDFSFANLQLYSCKHATSFSRTYDLSLANIQHNSRIVTFFFILNMALILHLSLKTHKRFKKKSNALIWTLVCFQQKKKSQHLFKTNFFSNIKTDGWVIPDKMCTTKYCISWRKEAA